LCQSLRSAEWFPLDEGRNTKEKALPTLVWIVPDGDREPLPYFRKYGAKDLELSEEFLSDMGITREESTTNAAKVFAQLNFMRNAWDAHPEIQKDVALSQRFKPRYRAMMRLLSRCPDLSAGSVNVPLLCEQGEQTCWQDRLEAGTPIYFAGTAKVPGAGATAFPICLMRSWSQTRRESSSLD
jgi:hypothetical protein